MIFNANLRVKHVTGVKHKIMININACVKKYYACKKVVVGIVGYVFVRIVVV